MFFSFQVMICLRFQFPNSINYVLVQFFFPDQPKEAQALSNWKSVRVLLWLCFSLYIFWTTIDFYGFVLVSTFSGLP